VAVLIGGQDFRIYRIERDEEKIQDLTEREAQFWQMVQQDQQPEPDGSSDAANALSWLFPRDDGQTVDLSDSPEFNQLFGELLRLRQQRKLSSCRSRNSNSGCKRPG
jgi:predicted phage-related endonuclease